MKLEKNELKDNTQNNGVEVKITYDDYKKIRRRFPRKFLKLFLIPTILWIFISLVALTPNEEYGTTTPFELIIADIVMILFWLLISIVISLIFRKSDYKRLLKNNIDKAHYTLYFYDDYILKLSENIKEKIKYYNIKKYNEFNSILYLITNSGDIIPVPKLLISGDLIDQIKYKVDNSCDNQSISNYSYSSNMKIKKYNIINIILVILFVFTLFTPWIAMGFIAMLIQKNQVFDLDFVKYTYGALFALPIPVISLILGIKYNNRYGIKGLKNIISGALMIGFILIINLFSLIPSTINYDRDYSEIDAYRKIINIDLPKEGKYTSIKWDSSYLIEHVSNTVRFTNNSDVNEFYQKVKNNENWITKDEIGTTLSNFIPTSLMCSSSNYECYYSVYNEELNSYNTIPNEDGDYHIHTMFYDYNVGVLKIEDFIYNYKK